MASPLQPPPACSSRPRAPWAACPSRRGASATGSTARWRPRASLHRARDGRGALARLGEGDEAPLTLIPQLEPGRAQTVPDRQSRHVVEDRVLVMRALQVVVRDLGAEVVDVVQADVAREELQHLRELEIAAAPQRGIGVAPAVGALPVGVLELVL